MSSSFSLRIKQYLGKERNFCITLLIIVCYSFGTPLTVTGLKELYKIHTLVIDQCQVKSIDLKIRYSVFCPRWNFTVLHENQTRNGSLISSTGFRTKSQAWSVANEYKINETYSCYRSKNDISVTQWGWQWNEPSKLETGAFVFGGVTSLSIGIVVAILRRRYQDEFKRIRQQEEERQPAILLKNEQRHQTI